MFERSLFQFRTIKTYDERSGRQKRNKNNWIHFIIYRREKILTQKCCETLVFFFMLFLHSHSLLLRFVVGGSTKITWSSSSSKDKWRPCKMKAWEEREELLNQLLRVNYSTSANIQKNYNHQTVVLFYFNLKMNEAKTTTSTVSRGFESQQRNRLRFIALWNLKARNNELFSTFTSFTRFSVSNRLSRVFANWKQRGKRENPFFIELNEAEVLDCEWWRSFGCWNIISVVMKMSMTWKWMFLHFVLCFPLFHLNEGKEREINFTFSTLVARNFPHYVSEKTSKHL